MSTTTSEGCSHAWLVNPIPDRIKAQSLRVSWIPGSKATCADCGAELELRWVEIAKVPVFVQQPLELAAAVSATSVDWGSAGAQALARIVDKSINGEDAIN